MALFSHAPQTKEVSPIYRIFYESPVSFSPALRLFLRHPLWDRHHRQCRKDPVGGIQLHRHSGEHPLSWRGAMHRPREAGRIGGGERRVDEPGALAVLPGSAQALQPSTPARHSFTVADQVNQLASAREVDPDRGFMARTMALCSLPRSNPGNRLQYKRVNGPFTLGMIAGLDNKLPFGNLPRLILAWLCTEVVRAQSREIVLGKSLSDFMRTLGVYSSAGNVHLRLRNQMKRLFSCSVSLTYTAADREASAHAVIADTTDFWWSRSDGSIGWKSKIRLSEGFFDEVIRHPVPLDMNTLTALKRSSLGLDLYLWLTSPQRLTWRQLYRQFGADPEKASDKFTVRNFRSKVLRELAKIKLAWPELNYSTARGVLILWPSTPLIPPSTSRI